MAFSNRPRLSARPRVTRDGSVPSSARRTVRHWILTSRSGRVHACAFPDQRATPSPQGSTRRMRVSSTAAQIGSTTCSQAGAMQIGPDGSDWAYRQADAEARPWSRRRPFSIQCRSTRWRPVPSPRRQDQQQQPEATASSCYRYRTAAPNAHHERA